MQKLHASTSFHLTLPKNNWESLAAGITKDYHASDIWMQLSETPAIAEVRKLIAFASQTPFADKKIAILGFADQLRPETSNALLKILEEPPAYLRIMLVSESGRLLATVRSRVAELEVAKDLHSSAGADKSYFERWHDLLSSYTVENEDSRKTVQRLLYLQPLNHATVNQDEVIQAYQ